MLRSITPESGQLQKEEVRAHEPVAPEEEVEVNDPQRAFPFSFYLADRRGESVCVLSFINLSKNKVSEILVLSSRSLRALMRLGR